MRARPSASQARGIDVVELGGDDQAVHDRGPLAAAIRAREQPRLAAESNAAQGALGGVVRQPDPAVLEAAHEGIPPLSHVVHRLADLGMATALAAVLARPRLSPGA